MKEQSMNNDIKYNSAQWIRISCDITKDGKLDISPDANTEPNREQLINNAWTSFTRMKLAQTVYGQGRDDELLKELTSWTRRFCEALDSDNTSDRVRAIDIFIDNAAESLHHDNLLRATKLYERTLKTIGLEEKESDLDKHIKSFIRKQ